MGPEISKRYSSDSSCPINSKLFLQQPWVDPHKTCCSEFWISPLLIFKKNFNFLPLVYNGKFQNATPLTVLARSIPNYFCNNLGWSLTKLVAQNFEFHLYWFLKKTLNFVYHWSIWDRKFQNATPQTVLARSIPNYFCNNLGWSLTKLVAQNFEFWLCLLFKIKLRF